MAELEIYRRGHGLQLDHVGLGVPDTKAGAEWLEERTGARVHLTEPDPNQWYWSGALPIGTDSFLEVIGPNPSWRRFQPFRSLLKTLKEPQLLFWYIAVNDFEAFRRLADQQSAGLERIESVNPDSTDPSVHSFIRGYVGPGFLTQRPNVIQWRNRPFPVDADTRCLLQDFRLQHPDGAKITDTFHALGIETAVAVGESSIGLTLDTPNGAVQLDNPGISLVGVSALITMARLWLTAR
ncbi:MAG: VOC family protein [Pseudomonadota bacterium]